MKALMRAISPGTYAQPQLVFMVPKKVYCHIAYTCSLENQLLVLDRHRDVGGNEQHASKETLKENSRAKEDINIIKKITEPLQNCAELCTYAEACPEVVQTTRLLCAA
ncbi:hypothetical protein L6452_37075 [Arctium lappa]|uniref:Uncharacterized protein n=1 Tax=Arctium lappa TaxID=4217 RepID=A0ACB8Y312_ARCLA|nr:hypothetical protein L6452_37075 [Arctium lappa]